MIPLTEVLSEIIGAGPNTKKVMQQYVRLMAEFKSELNLLLYATLEEIECASMLLAEAIRRMRSGCVIRKAGFDGEYGVIKVFRENELESLGIQRTVFAE